MALEDYYKKLNFVEYKRVPDGFGGWKGVWEVGAEFDGLITLASDTIQNTEALRGNLAKQYKLSTRSASLYRDAHLEIGKDTSI